MPFARLRSALVLAALVLATLPAPAAAQAPPKREWRAAWMATVTNLDWPRSGSSPADQRADLVYYLDELKASGVNAVVFQVRPEGDAFYRSTLEPWSCYLTGTQGQAPPDGYDPLAFAIQEAHRRGMELHAWFNPFRAAVNADGCARVLPHLSVAHPEWTIRFPRSATGDFLMFDPGRSEVRNHSARVVADVVRRYDVDGVHFDDYFYPYPVSGRLPSGIANQDDASCAADARCATLGRADWRRDNVNRFVAQVADSIRSIKPWVKYGISPFGIWRNGVPSGITGLDAYNVIYADAVTWMQRQSLDYLTPQLYWVFGGNQDYAKLAPWWQTVINGRHLYPGLITSTNQIPRQIRFNRANAIPGWSLFRTGTVITNTSGVEDSLRQRLDVRPAFAPLMPWKGDTTPPAAPANVRQSRAGTNWDVTWTKPAPAADGDTARYYAVYRHSGVEPLDLSTSNNLVGVVGGGVTSFRAVSTGEGEAFVVTALDKLWNESAPAEPVLADADRPGAPAPFGLGAVYPNPAAGAVTVRYRLDAPGAVTLDLYDLAGRRVARLVEDSAAAPGERQAVWNRRAVAGALAPGLYVLRLRQGGRTATAPLTLL